MPKPVSEYTDPDDLRIVMENAERLGHDDYWWEAFNRRCELLGMKELEGVDQPEPLHSEFYKTLIAYEQLLTIKNNGRTTTAARTRQKLKKDGLVACLENWAVKPAPTDGFELLIENGLANLTGEYLVVKYPKHFSEKAVAFAKRRLTERGAKVPESKY